MEFIKNIIGTILESTFFKSTSSEKLIMEVANRIEQGNLHEDSTYAYECFRLYADITHQQYGREVVDRTNRLSDELTELDPYYVPGDFLSNIYVPQNATFRTMFVRIKDSEAVAMIKMRYGALGDLRKVTDKNLLAMVDIYKKRRFK